MTEFSRSTVVLTGATSGLGAALAEAFWLEGADLFVVGRNSDRLAHLAGTLPVKTGQRVVTRTADLGRIEDVAGIIEAATVACGALDVLVNCAAMQGPIGPAWENDAAEWRQTMQVNLLAPVALCRAFIRAPGRPGRRRKIVNVSGGGATSSRPMFSAYATTKVGLVRFSETLADETRALSVDVNCVAPGAMATAMTEAISSAGASRAGAREVERARRVSGEGRRTLDKAVALCVFLASSASDGITGRLLSAVWDPWETLADRREELAATDIYTLRRIVPSDRGRTWGDR